MSSLLLTATLVTCAIGGSGQNPSTFEAPLAHAVAVATDAEQLFAVNPADHRLAVFSLADPERPRLEREIPVGLEPVALAVRNPDEVWVVNWLSDAVSVVSLELGCVIATIQVGDEPGDIVFAGSPPRAFVSVTGPREVVVIDPGSRSVVARVPVFADAPRALCTDAAGAMVWVASQRSGNGTTIVPQELAPLPPTPTSPELPSAPRQGIIVRADDPAWSELGIALPDLDVFGIDAAKLRVVERHAGVGTALFDVSVDPATGDLWVANTEARNLVRFEPALRGHVVDHRVTRIVRGEQPRLVVHDLNPTVDHSRMADANNHAVALAQPTAVAFSPDGDRLFVAAFGSDRVAALDREGAVVTRIEIAPEAERGDPRRMRGPRALAHHPDAPLLYVLNGVGHSLATVDTERCRVVSEVPLGFDPTPPFVRSGRGFLYSARLSGTGTASCSSCHIDGDWDGMVWDLGDPGGAMEIALNRDVLPMRMHPMKGPMKTQTLRGLLPEVAPFHHRGDRERLQDFNPAFRTLLGGSELPDRDMDAYVRFLQTLRFPPNPNRTLANAYPDAGRVDGVPGGEELFRTGFQRGASCMSCHLNEAGTSGVIVTGHLLQYQAQSMKVAQLRDVYKRTAREPQGGLRMSGFGLFHDGSHDSVFDFLGRPFFRHFARSQATRRELERFVQAFDTGVTPSVGWAATVRAGADPAGLGDLDIVEEQAAAGHCDLIVKGRCGGRLRGFVYDAKAAVYRADDPVEAPRSRRALLDELTGADAITFLGVPAGSGRRMGVDRDADGVLDALDR